MPDHVDPVSSPEETADNTVSPPADSPFVTCSPLNAMRESPMPDHVDPASSVEEAAGNAGGAGNTDNVVSLPTDNPFSAMERS